MPKKILSVLLLLPLVFTGCANSRRIESASVIESVSVAKQNGTLYYTFYPLTDEDAPRAVGVAAASFEEAQRLAEERYIPNLSLAKLELLLYHEDVGEGVLRTDAAYISTQASFSPIAYLALCDEKTLRRMRQKTETQATVKQQLILCKNQNPSVNLDYLSVFNSYSRDAVSSFSVPYISVDTELRVSTIVIHQ